MALDAESLMAYFAPHEIAALVHSHYISLNFKPPQNQFTILAAFILLNKSNSAKVISLGTGSKCLAASKLQSGGDLVHDSHAEILARRGAVRFFFEEISRAVMNFGRSDWIELVRGRFELTEGTEVYLYVSTPPCKLIDFVYQGFFLIMHISHMHLLVCHCKVATHRLDTLHLSKMRPWPHSKIALRLYHQRTVPQREGETGILCTAS